MGVSSTCIDLYWELLFLPTTLKFHTILQMSSTDHDSPALIVLQIFLIPELYTARAAPTAVAFVDALSHII
jgi:hypothetical protein